MATLADLRTTMAGAIRDSNNNTFSVAELDDLINQGIDALADVYPREIQQTIGTVSAGVLTYDISSFTNIFRVDIHTSDGSYRAELPHAYGDRDSGWESHGGILYLPPNWTLPAGDTLRAYGYGRYVQLSASTDTTDLDQSGIWAVRVFVQAEAYNLLLTDRVLFQQWVAESGNTDVTALALNQLAFGMRSRWAAEQRRLRRVRKL